VEYVEKWGQNFSHKAWRMPNHCCRNNIKMDLKRYAVNWISFSGARCHWQAYVNTVMNLWFPLNTGNFLTSCVTVSFSKTKHHNFSQCYVCCHKLPVFHWMHDYHSMAHLCNGKMSFSLIEWHCDILPFSLT
jgi:hypothetical protein